MQTSWAYCKINSTRSLSESNLRKMFIFPQIKLIYLTENQQSHDLGLDDKYNVKYVASLEKVKPHFVVFVSSVCGDNAVLYYLRSWPQSQGPWIVTDPARLVDPEIWAAQTQFWLPLQMFSQYPALYEKYKNGITIAIALEKDDVPIKTKRIWIKKYLAALQDRKGLMKYILPTKE